MVFLHNVEALQFLNISTFIPRDVCICMHVKDRDPVRKSKGRWEKSIHAFLCVYEQSHLNSPLHTLLHGCSLDTVFVE